MWIKNLYSSKQNGKKKLRFCLEFRFHRRGGGVHSFQFFPFKDESTVDIWVCVSGWETWLSTFDLMHLAEPTLCVLQLMCTGDVSVPVVKHASNSTADWNAFNFVTRELRASGLQHPLLLRESANMHFSQVLIFSSYEFVAWCLLADPGSSHTNVPQRSFSVLFQCW